MVNYRELVKQALKMLESKNTSASAEELLGTTFIRGFKVLKETTGSFCSL
jgi:hypothetical protein